jgi:hypothetical protein
MEIIVSESTDTAALVGQTVSTEQFGPFVVVSADLAPELSAVAYAARDVQDGYLFLAFNPYGKSFVG